MPDKGSLGFLGSQIIKVNLNKDCNMSNKDTKKVLISMKKEFLDLIDNLADSEHRSRSELIREAVRLYVKTKSGI